ncbi:MAG: NYN domain-containing protein [Blastocatellia bacterium]
MTNQQAARIAVYIDFENISLSATRQFGDFDLGLVLKAIQQRGRVTLKRAYGDWSRLGAYRDAVRENAVELVQLYSYSYQQGGKNRADIRLVIDVMESLFTLDYIETVVIVSGDSDFSSVMSKVREYGKHTIGVGVRASTSDMLIKACDDFIFYDDLIETAYEQLKSRREEAVSEAGEGARQAAAQASAPAPVQTPAPIAAPGAAQGSPGGAPGSTEVPRPSTGKLNVIKLTPAATAVSGTHPLPAASASTAISERNAVRYFFEDLRLPIVAPEVRAGVLADLLDSVEQGAPLNHSIDRLKARYDFENIYRQRVDIRVVTRLACRAGIFDFGAERPSLSAFVQGLKEDDPERAGLRVDELLLRVALEANLKLTVAGATDVLFAPSHGRDYCAGLLDEMEDQNLVDSGQGQYFIRQTDALGRLLQAPELTQVRYDLERSSLDPGDRIGREEVNRLFDTANKWRRSDFAASAGCALRGLKIMTELHRQREPGLGTDEFLWGVANYCCSRAGVSFRNRDYIAARDYYLAFFWIAQEGDYAWELLRPLLPSLLSYFWMTLSHELNVRVGSFTGHNAPADTVIAVVGELNDFGQGKLKELARELASVNASLLRSLTAQIEGAPPAPPQQRALEILSSSVSADRL